METNELALFLHILTLLAAIGLGTTLHTAEWMQRKATTVQELRTITRPYKWGRLFPVLIILLLATGAWLIHLSDGGFHFDDGWVETAIAALVVLFVSGGAVLGRHASRYGKLLAATPDGPITDEVRRTAFDPVAWGTSHMNTALALGVVCNMVNKPGLTGSIVTLVVAAAIGTAIGLAGRPR